MESTRSIKMQGDEGDQGAQHNVGVVRREGDRDRDQRDKLILVQNPDDVQDPRAVPCPEDEEGKLPLSATNEVNFVLPPKHFQNSESKLQKH